MLAHRLYLQELEIRARFKATRAEAIAKHPSKKRRGVAVSFSLRGLGDRRKNAVAMVAAQGGDAAAFEQCLHRSADGLDRSRRSAACPYEHFRARLWALTEVPQLFPVGPTTHWVTITPLHHRGAAPDLARFDPRKTRRIVGALRSKLKEMEVMSTVFGMLEVTVRIESEGPIFEPHVHFIMAGPTRGQLDRAIGQTLPSGITTITPVYSVEGLCLYLTKFAATERSAYTGDRGRRGSQPNGMEHAEKAAWLSWMAQFGIGELVIQGGFQPSLKTRFLAAEMGDLLDRAVGRAPPNGPKMLSTRRLCP